MTPEERLKQAQEQTNAVARAAGSLWGTTKWAAKTGWGMLKFAMGMGHEEFGESAVEAAQDPKRATQAYIEGKKREYNESLDRAQQHMLKGEHFAAGAGFTEEFTAPTAADAVITVEGVGGLGRAAVRRTAPAVDRLRAAMQQAAEAQAREPEFAMARAIAAGRRSELGAAGRIMSDDEARRIIEAAQPEQAEVLRGSGGPGKVYEIPGSELSSGLPYRGRTRQATVEKRMAAKDHRAKTPTGTRPRATLMAEGLTVQEMEGLEALLIDEAGLENLTNKIRGLDPSLAKNEAKIEAGKRILEQRKKNP